METGDRASLYADLLAQAEALLDCEKDTVATLANVSAAIKEKFAFLWCGFYVVRSGRLVLGPFQGHVACSSIGYGKGVCGTAWKEKRTVIVDDVERFDGYIACSSLAKSEIVVPVFASGEVAAVMDIDSEYGSDFTETDAEYLGSLASLLSSVF